MDSNDFIIIGYALLFPIILTSIATIIIIVERNKKVGFKHIVFSIVSGVINSFLSWIIVLLIAGLLNYPEPIDQRGLELFINYGLSLFIQLSINWIIIKLYRLLFGILKKSIFYLIILAISLIISYILNYFVIIALYGMR